MGLSEVRGMKTKTFTTKFGEKVTVTELTAKEYAKVRAERDAQIAEYGAVAESCHWEFIKVNQTLYQYKTNDGDVFISVSPNEFDFSFCPFCGKVITGDLQPPQSGKGKE